MAIAYHGHPIPLWPRIGVRARRRPTRAATDLSLPAGEHALLRETAQRDRAYYLASERALYCRGADDLMWRRLAWVDVASVEAARRAGTLVLRCWPGYRQPPVALVLGERSRLPALARERIAACQVLVRRIELDGLTVVVTACREPGTDTTTWSAHVEQPGEHDRPELSALDRAIRELRAQAGC